MLIYFVAYLMQELYLYFSIFICCSIATFTYWTHVKVQSSLKSDTSILCYYIYSAAIVTRYFVDYELIKYGIFS